MGFKPQVCYFLFVIGLHILKIRKIKTLCGFCIRMHCLIMLTGPRVQGHIVADIPLATVGASKRLPSEMFFNIVYVIWTILNYVRLSCNQIKVEVIYLYLYDE